MPFCACEKLGARSYLIERIWRPRRDLNPCYRRERFPFERKRQGRRIWRVLLSCGKLAA